MQRKTVYIAISHPVGLLGRACVAMCYFTVFIDLISDKKCVPGFIVYTTEVNCLY